MTDLYRDRWIICSDDAISIRWYYPWGTKRVPYSAIRGVERVRVALLGGKGRIWGSTSLQYWASLDPGRPHKEIGLILDLGRHIRPFITPDDPEAVWSVIKREAGLPEIPEAGTAPLI